MKLAWGESNSADRQKGDAAEVEAATHFEASGCVVVRHPLGKGRHDLVVWTPGKQPCYVEVRCKYPDKKDRYGLEFWKVPEWRALDVVYLIKDTARKGWFYAKMGELPAPEVGPAGSWLGGGFDPAMPNAYWPAKCWRRLDWEYEGPAEAA